MANTLLTAKQATLEQGGSVQDMADLLYPEILSSLSADAARFIETTGLANKRWRITPVDTNTSGSAELELVPGDDVNHSGLESQILLFGETGTDYERFVISLINGEIVIDSTANNAGTPRNIVFEMGGKVTPAISSQKAMILYADASVDLNGSSFTADSQTWGVTRTRIADRQNTGDTRLIIDTRTGTPADNSADDAFIEFRRGGSQKARAGLNVTGANVDGWEVTTAGGGQFRIEQDGDIDQSQNINIASGKGYKVNGQQVLGDRVTGWTQATGTADRTTFNTATVTTEELAKRVKALIDDAFTHGFLGP